MLKVIKEIYNNRRLKIFFVICSLLSFTYATIPCVYAEEDPLQVINNLSNLMSSFISAIGGIILLFGVVQIGMSFNSHDPTQRINGFMTFVAGLIIASAKFILNKIM